MLTGLHRVEALMGLSQSAYTTDVSTTVDAATSDFTTGVLLSIVEGNVRLILHADERTSYHAILCLQICRTSCSAGIVRQPQLPGGSPPAVGPARSSAHPLFRRILRPACAQYPAARLGHGCMRQWDGLPQVPYRLLCRIEVHSPGDVNRSPGTGRCSRQRVPHHASLPPDTAVQCLITHLLQRHRPRLCGPAGTGVLPLWMQRHQLQRAQRDLRVPLGGGPLPLQVLWRRDDAVPRCVRVRGDVLPAGRGGSGGRCDPHPGGALHRGRDPRGLHPRRHCQRQRVLCVLGSP